jgi:hypothetical protein
MQVIKQVAYEVVQIQLPEFFWMLLIRLIQRLQQIGRRIMINIQVS